MLEKLNADIKQSMLAGNRSRIDTLKMLKAALQNETIAVGRELAEEDQVRVINRELKKRKEAAELYRSNGAVDKAISEEQEANVLSEYAPAMLQGDELERALDSAQVEIAGMNFGQIMAFMSSRFGNLDKAELAKLIKDKGFGK